MVFSEYTYTLETIIQAGHKKLSIESVPVRVNEDHAPFTPSKEYSFLYSPIGDYFNSNLCGIPPVSLFWIYWNSFFVAGFLIGLRFVYYYLTGEWLGPYQSLILMSVLLGMGFHKQC